MAHLLIYQGRVRASSIKASGSLVWYPLGQWNEELEEEDRLAVEGKYYLTGEKVAQRKVTGSDIDDLFKD